MTIVKKRKKESLVLGRLFQKLTKQIGAKVLLEPSWGIAGQIQFASGKTSYFRYNTVDLNPVGSSDIARDKDYANFFMARLGYPTVPQSKTFFSDRWATAIGEPKRRIDNAWEYALRIGLPVVVKPNSGSQGGGVEVVYGRQQFYRAMKEIFKRDKVALIQKVLSGNDYRVVVLDDEVISAYQRIPLNVVGDGRRTIRQLLGQKQREFYRQKRDSKIKFDDPRILYKLRRQKLSLVSVPVKGQQVFLLDNANLSSGGDSRDVSKIINPKFAEFAIQLSKQMGLRLCGVDLMIDGTIADEPTPDKFWVLEINAAPGLDHYVRSGREQEKVVEQLYLKVLKAIDIERYK